MGQISNSALRRIPSVSKVLEHPTVVELTERCGHPLVTYAVRATIERVRHEILDGQRADCSAEQVVLGVRRVVRSIRGRSLRPVINATGVILHTNLGRAPLARSVADEIAETAAGYSNLEFDLERGRRGRRSAHVVEILRFLTGSEDAVVTNNNAAAILLALTTLARDREVVVSRGELIEIGGSFRIPEIMAASGARMVEVGATNRTRPADYEAAIGPETAILFKAHKSNYAITGFTEEASVAELAALAHAHGLIMVYDIGSGLLRRLPDLPLGAEPDAHSAITAGADLVTFSCDKLLGGPQAGIAAGKGELVAQLAKAPLMRALRVGKLTLAGLSSVCRAALNDEDLLAANPALSMLARNKDELTRLAASLLGELENRGVAGRIVESTGQPGGGSLPEVRIPSVAVELLPPDGPPKQRQTFAEAAFAGLLRQDPPVLGVLREGRLLLDVMAVFEHDIPSVAAAAVASIQAEGAP